MYNLQDIGHIPCYDTSDYSTLTELLLHSQREQQQVNQFNYWHKDIQRNNDGQKERRETNTCLLEWGRGFIKGQALGKLIGCQQDLAINLPGCFRLLFLLSFIGRTKTAGL